MNLIALLWGFNHIYKSPIDCLAQQDESPMTGGHC